MSRNYSEKQNAGRFEDLCVALDAYVAANRNGKGLLKGMITHERNARRKTVSMPSRTKDEMCLLVKLGKKDARAQLPSPCLEWLQVNHSTHWEVKSKVNDKGTTVWGQGSKVTLTWIKCYLKGVKPDKSLPGWKFFECSHRCLCANNQGKKGFYCLKSTHLVWESSAVNQGRGYKLCMGLCHCGCGFSVCVANGIHNPCCL